MKKKTYVDKHGLQLVELPSQGEKFSPGRRKDVSSLALAKKRSSLGDR